MVPLQRFEVFESFEVSVSLPFFSVLVLFGQAERCLRDCSFLYSRGLHRYSFDRHLSFSVCLFVCDQNLEKLWVDFRGILR